MRFFLFLLASAQATLNVLDIGCSMDTSGETILNISDVGYLASDALGGREDGTEGSILAQDYIINELIDIGAVGLDPSKTGRDAFRVDIREADFGTNIVGMLEGETDKYIYLSAHYDHIGVFCRSVPNAKSHICNGAMDNAAGVAIVLGVGRFLKAHPEKRRHNVVFTFWGRHEEGRLGSEWYIDFPLSPLENAIMFNWDIQGANISPSTKLNTMAFRAETGGGRLQRALKRAVRKSGTNLDVVGFSHLVDQGRSDHSSFAAKELPTLFFSDATNGCYHSDGDELQNVDFDKLEKQAKIAASLVYDVSCRRRIPRFNRRRAKFPLGAYRDLWRAHRILNKIVKKDLAKWDEENRQKLLTGLRTIKRARLIGPIMLLRLDEVIEIGADVVNALAFGECSSFAE